MYVVNNAKCIGGSPYEVMAKILDCYDVHFWINTLGKGMNPLIPPSYGLNSITVVLLYKDDLSIH